MTLSSARIYCLFAFLGQVKIVAERQELSRERFSAGKVPFVTCIDAKKQRFPGQKVCNWGRKVNFFATFLKER